MWDSVPVTKLKKLCQKMLNQTNWKLLLKIIAHVKNGLKKVNMISSAQTSATSNPFVVYGFYDNLKEVMSEKKFLSLQIWNLDKLAFPTDTGRCKVIAPKEKVVKKNNFRSRQQEYHSITCLPCFKQGYWTFSYIHW